MSDLDLRFFIEKAPLMTAETVDKLHCSVFKMEGARWLSVLMLSLPCFTTAFYYFTSEENGSGSHIIDGYLPFGEQRIDCELTFHWNDNGTAPFKLTLSYYENKFTTALDPALLLDKDKLNETILEFKKRNFDF